MKFAVRNKSLLHSISLLDVWLLVLPSFAFAAQASQQERPNIVVIVGDDMGYADVGVHGSRDILTPHLDALAAAGIRCSNGYVSGPYCSPTRAGLLTGRYQTRFGHEFNPGGSQRRRQRRGQEGEQSQRQSARQQTAGAAREIGLPTSQTTIADRMKAAGYKTGLVGKWHLGNAGKFHPQQRGFDEFFGFLGGAHSYFPVENPPILRGTKPVDEEEYLTDAFAREAIAFIDRHRDEPFFLYLAFNAVHTPMHATNTRVEKFVSIADKQRRTYAAMMSAMDDAVGAIVDRLRQLQLEDNTLVFFISDNGGPSMNGTTKNGSDNSPLRGSKRTTLEGGIRVPFLVKWPRQLSAGKVYDQPIIQLDILPTALAAAGAAATDDANIDGVDLLPYLSGENDGKPHESLYWRLGQQMAIRKGDWKLVRYDPRVDGMSGKATEPKLYDLANDIGETKDLIDEQPEKAKLLQVAWDTWNASNVDPLWGNSRGRRGKAASRSAAAEPATLSTRPTM